MLALREPSIVAIVSASLSAATLVVVALIGRQGRRDRHQIKKGLAAENGHDSLGGGLAAVETMLMDHGNRLDRIEVKVDEASVIAKEAVGFAAENRTLIRGIMEDDGG